jgi:GAF domain-containing protein
MALDDRPAAADPLHLIAELRRERDEALAREAAIAEVLGVINSSPGDLAPVFDAMLEKATTLCDAPKGQLAIYDGEFFRFVAAHGEASHVHDLLARGTMLPVSGTTWPRIVAGEHVVHIPDVRESDHYRAGHENTRKFVEVSGARSLLTVALRKDNVLMGALSVYRQHARPFTDKQIALLQNFAAQAVIAMENARLITETREALEQQTATAEVLGVINASPGDLAPVFDAMLEKAMRLCEAKFGLMSTYHDGSFRSVARRGVPNALRDFLLGDTPSPGRHSVLPRIIAGEDIVHVEDLSVSPQYLSGEPRARAFVDIAGARSYVVVALRKESELLGAFSVYRQQVRPFTDKQIALLQNFAAQAVIAMENARLITETREALEQQTATAEVLGVINSSPGDLAPVFDAILERAMSRCDAAFGFMTIYDGQVFIPCAMRNVPEPLAEYFAKDMDQPQRGDAHWQLLQGTDLVHNIDQKAEDAYRSGNPLRRAVVDLGGTRTALVIALRKDGVLRGTLTLYRQEVRPFANEQIALLQNFAAQAVIAMQNARLITETREALEQQTATAEVLQVINASPGELAPVFDALLEKAARLCGADFGAFFAHDGQHLKASAVLGATDAYAEFLLNNSVQVSQANMHGRLMAGEPFIHIPDVSLAPAYLSGDPMQRAFVDLGRGRTVLGVPLWRDNVFLGELAIYRCEVRPFSEKQTALLQNFAAQAEIAMENARLITETREALEQQTATAEVLGVINSSPVN